MFYYELHSHTCVGSLCSRVKPEDYIRFYIDKGYSGMVITDHFYHGNTAIERTLAWEEFVDEFCDGYYRAKKVGDECGFSVFFGFEHKFMNGTDEYLVLGITPDWLKEHPDIIQMKRAEFFTTVRKAGGFIIQAHPFRVCYYISDIRLALDCVDAVEVLNIGHDDVYSRQAYEYAKNLGLPMTGGSDIHSLKNRDVVSGVALQKKVSSIDELITEIKEGRSIPAPLDRFEQLKQMPLERILEVDVYKLTEEGLELTYDIFEN